METLSGAKAQLEMEDQLNHLVEKHCAAIRDTVSEIGELLDPASGCAPVDLLNAIKAAEELAYQLVGVSRAAGFHQIRHAVTALDNHLKGLCRDEPAEILYGIKEAMELFDRLDLMAHTITPNSSTLYRAA